MMDLMGVVRGNFERNRTRSRASGGLNGRSGASPGTWAIGLLLSSVAAWGQSERITALEVSQWDEIFGTFVEGLASATFLFALILPFILPFSCGRRWCTVLWKRCLYPAFGLLLLASCAWAILALPGPWRPHLQMFGFDPRYYDNLEGFASGGIFGLGAGAAPLAAQPWLILGIMLTPSLLGGLAAFLVQYVWGRLKR